MDYITIKGYKSIKEATIELKPINILIGSNGSGKSNFLSFFELLHQIYNRNFQQYVSMKGGEDKLLHKGVKVTEEISFRTEFDNGRNGYSAQIRRGNDGFIFIDERLIYNSDSGRIISNYLPESRLKLADNFRAKYVVNYLQGFKKYHFHDTGRNSPFNNSSNIFNDIHFLYDRGENLASFLFFIRENHIHNYNRIVRTIQSIAPFFSDFVFFPNNEGFLKLQWQNRFTSSVYGVTDLSDGTLRFIALAVLFLQPNLPSTIIIDEPELGLHPFAISKLAGLIQSVASKNVQVILATQSSDLVNYFTPEDIITVDQFSGESQFNRLDSQNLSRWLEEYTMGYLWQRNIIQGGQPR